MSIYHVFTKSIAGFKIFCEDKDYKRIIEMLVYYKDNPFIKFSDYKKLKFKKKQAPIIKTSPLVQILAYCIMPTHIHLVLYEKQEKGISEYMRRLLNSYTRYFNEKVKRKGPLWQSRFKKVLVNSDEQLLHLTRYVHLNPVSVGIIESPEKWWYSSYREYIGLERRRICEIEPFLEISEKEYKKFVEERKDYQKSLELIKHLILE